jgi:hypothetical protein
MEMIVSDIRERLILINGLNICGNTTIRIDNSIDSEIGN